MKRRKTYGAAMAVVTALALGACGGDTIEVDRGLAVQTPGDDAVVSTHTSGSLDLSIRRPGVLDRGIVRFEVTARDEGEPVDGLTIVALSDMPTMNHPQELTPDVSGLGGTCSTCPSGCRASG